MELLTFVAKQLPFFIFPPTRVRHKKQNHLIKRAKRFQDGKWEDLWKQSQHEYEIEKAHIQPLREKSIDQKFRTSQHCHQQTAISKASKALTNDAKPTSDPWFRFDIQSLVYVHRVGLSYSWLFLTVFLIIFRGHTLFVFMYMSFA